MADVEEEIEEIPDDSFHMRERSTRGNYQCKKCGQRFTLPGNYRRHVLHNKICGSKKEGFECSNCLKQFSLNATMKDHYERCIAEDPYRFNCPHCPMLFTFKSSLNKHLRGRCKETKKNYTKKVHKCKYCYEEFFQYSAWRRHLTKGMCSKENDQQPHQCPHCANRFTMKSSLNKHLKGRCKAMKEASKDEKVKKYDLIVNIEEVNGEITPFEIITSDETISEDNFIVECNGDDNADDGWGTLGSDDVESYIEISNDDDYEFITIDNREKL